MTDDEPKDPKVKALVERDPSQPLEQFVDAATAAQLERWFGLPSFVQVAEGEVELVQTEDPGVAAVRERRMQLVHEIDPELLAAIEKRTTPREDLIKFAATIEPIDTTIALIDSSFTESRGSISEERLYDQPEDIEEALRRQNTPQALLRDLHRLESNFDRSADDEFTNFEDEAPPEPLLVDIAATIDEAMTMRFSPEPFVPPEITSLLDVTRGEIRRSWVEIANSGTLYNRRVTE